MGKNIDERDAPERNGIISKSAEVSTLAVNEKELNKINKMTLEPLKADDVFVFKVAMCDNAIDRDFEVFPLKTLNKLKSLFVGKTMIKDHRRSADNQIARIYDTELIASSTEVTEKGEVYTKLVGHCYMLNSEANKGFIDEIKAGIKKEVSVSLKTTKAVCSICGKDNVKDYCNHWWGKEYDGQTCHFSLEDPTDAYELSFVAVPAQPKAGTLKAYGGQKSKDGQPDDPVVGGKDLELEELELRMKSVGAFLFSTKNLEDEKE